MAVTPFFTVITATLNAAATLPRLLDSLAEQTCRDFELIIQDGASSDNTVAVAETYRERLPALSLVSEPDTGIYDAWNRALERAHGEWALFLGADDALTDRKVLRQAFERLRVAPEAVLFACGTVYCLDPRGNLRRTVYPQISRGGHMLRDGCIPVGHTALFHRRKLFDLVRFDISFRIAGDQELLSRAWDDSAAIDLNMTVTLMGAGGISESPFSTLCTRWEIFRIMWRHFAGHITFRSHLLPLVKGCVLHLLCMCLGKRHAPAMLDHLRVLRGLPPVWTKQVKE
ncbi:MAG: glycosyltransferase [Desulfovibrio sp.]|jgi:glycosyltransferase involved in cell wall biosynthesis|nr:glycosyltransferase [Desulfovibrio sp.]